MALEIIVLAAGQGKRMHSALPKVLHALAGRPLLGQWAFDVRRLLDALKADGRLPAMTKEAIDRQTAAAQARKGRRLDNPEERGVGERCVNFGVPNLNIASGAFGRSGSTATEAREFQLGLKVRF